MGKPEPEEKVPRWWFSTRFLITMLGSLCFTAMFALRVSFSLTLVCMVNHTALDLMKGKGLTVTNNNFNHYGQKGNSTGMSVVISMHNQTMSVFGNKSTAAPPDESCHGSASAAGKHTHKDGEFVWDKAVQGFMFSGFFIGYVLIEIPAGWLGTRFGAKRMLAFFMLMASVASLLSPMAARVHFGFLVALRVITGIGSGVVFPLVTVVLGRWSPPLETSRMGTITYAGAQIGCLLALIMSGQICERGLLGGWHTVFYMFGAFGIVWCVLWMFLASDTPRDHPRISNEEREYIIKSLNEDQDEKVAYVPWKDLLMSIPFWAIVATSACTDFGYLIFETNTPTYIKEVLKFDMESNGLLSAAPFLGIWIISVAGAFILDKLREKHILNTGQARKIAEAIGMILPAGLFVGISFMDCHQWVAAATMLVIGVSLIGGQYCGHFVNNMDIAPRYAGVVMAITNAVGSVMGILAPLVVGVVTKGQTREQWQIVFFIAAGIYVVGIVIFVAFASGDVQPWALDKTYPEKEQITVELADFKKTKTADDSTPQSGEPLLNGTDKSATNV